jgi:hypothetical protein
MAVFHSHSSFVSELLRCSADTYPGLLMKYSVGGSHARRMDFCRYLATRQLSVDVWDGDSLLQVGTASVDLRTLLRQVGSHSSFTRRHILRQECGEFVSSPFCYILDCSRLIC